MATIAHEGNPRVTQTLTVSDVLDGTPVLSPTRPSPDPESSDDTFKVIRPLPVD